MGVARVVAKRAEQHRERTAGGVVVTADMRLAVAGIVAMAFLLAAYAVFGWWFLAASPLVVVVIAVVCGLLERV